MFIATMNTPGYLPWDENSPSFETSAEAWAYLADERREQEDSAEYAGPGSIGSWYSETVDELDAYASAGHGPDVVYGGTPGYEGSHDLGIAYCVTEEE